MLLSFIMVSFLEADSLDSAVNLTKKANENSVMSQEKIDKLLNKKEGLYYKYKALEAELNSVNEYNSELKQIVNSQNEEKKSILKQINQIDETKRDILPLIKNMLSSLEEMINNDTPFLYEERTKRIQRIKKLIKRSDITIASKYRSVIEAYEIETEYSRTIETYNDILNDRSVKYLRVGRVAFYYVSEDGSSSAIWNNKTKSWNMLDSSYSYKINSAIKIAAKKSVPNLLKLPLFKAQEVM